MLGRSFNPSEETDVSFSLVRKPSVVLALFAALSACAGTSRQVDNLRDVDVLVSQVELVHFEAELAKSRAGIALEKLHDIVAGRFEIDAVATYAEFVSAVETSEDQADELRSTVEPMHELAEDVFTTWAENLQAFTTAGLRQRSQVRLDATRSRYDAVLAAVGQAQEAYDAFNLGLRDHAIYLENDFNAASVAGIEGEVVKLTDWAGELDRRLSASMDAAEDYVRAASLPGTLTLSRVPNAAGDGS